MNIAGTDSVTTDMDTHTVTVQFDDDELSIDEIIGALGDAGYTVPSHAKIP
ncbi:MAG: heavy-metal-associated domain-containing protein [Deltaproteobacteria bacterium]|nr:heavy-metal-associated domain-containing protein [Deltaproteobacteria bacterium]MBW2400503.1 heavy-metal-associated domain-containing protein [Deltaproteobacteria bacterium]MBW2666731.1 heavy-metal-associated domain-containing protein [Deltaproteobacteria bacterium]